MKSVSSLCFRKILCDAGIGALQIREQGIDTPLLLGRVKYQVEEESALQISSLHSCDKLG